MHKENNFTTYSLLCKTPTEDEKIYYWENMCNLFPLLNEIMKNFSSSKILSWQHFEKLKWLKDENCYRSSGSPAPTGGCINWSHENIEKTLTTYLKDRSFHYHVWNNHNGLPIKPISTKPINPRGYIFHYSTTIFGDRVKLKPDISTDWYNRITDFRFQIQYYFNQLSDFGVNQIVDITFRESFLAEDKRDEFVNIIFSLIYGKYLFKRHGIIGCGFTQTFHQAYCTDKHLLNEWKQIVGTPIKLDI
jgi:hypothetical protein